jgi:hypothetical protein
VPGIYSAHVHGPDPAPGDLWVAARDRFPVASAARSSTSVPRTSSYCGRPLLRSTARANEHNRSLRQHGLLLYEDARDRSYRGTSAFSRLVLLPQPDSWLALARDAGSLPGRNRRSISVFRAAADCAQSNTSVGADQASPVARAPVWAESRSF